LLFILFFYIEIEVELLKHIYKNNRFDLSNKTHFGYDNRNYRTLKGSSFRKKGYLVSNELSSAA